MGRLWQWFCPAGALLSFASPKESKQRKGDPRRGRSLRDCPALLGRPGGCATRPLPGLRQCSPTSPVRPALLGGPNGGPKVKGKVKTIRAPGVALVLKLGSPLGPPRSAACLGVVREHCLRERSDRVAQRPRHASIAGQSPQATGPSGVAFFWLLFLAKQEK